jgi:hypothetical protein
VGPEAAILPARIKIRTLPDNKLLVSNDISFAAGWSQDLLERAALDATAQRMQN